MFTWSKEIRQQGFTFIELIIVTALTVIIFGAIIVAFQFALELNDNTRVKLSALSLANDRMEFFRSLPYDDVGLVASFPPGLIPQTSTFELNGFTISEQIWVDYEDDPADGEDGTGTPDSNGIAQDYKLIKAEYTWNLRGNTNSLSLVSTIVPRSVETNVGAGTIRINVLDADNTLLPGATVQILGSSSTFPYDTTRPSNADGTALFSVPADGGYQAFVTANIAGNQYSTSSTYIPSPSNPNPVVAPFAVGEGGVSTLTFKIGALSDLEILLWSNVVEGSYEESFLNALGIASSTNTSVSSGELSLSDSFGVYETNGIAYVNSIEPTTLERWESVRVVSDLPSNTDFKIRFYTGSTSAYTLIPDSELAGNSVGFTDTLIDISELDTILYPTTTIGISFNTTDTSETAAIRELEIFWRESSTPLGSETLSVQGAKIIGTDASSTPIYKTTGSIVTNGLGEGLLEDLEFDTYTVTPTGLYTTAWACPANPFNLPAGTDSELEFVYIPAVATSVRLTAVDSLGRPVPGASVRLQRAGYDQTRPTNSCGQTFFSGGGLTDAADYELTISSPGYASESIDPFDVAGETSTNVILTP